MTKQDMAKTLGFIGVGHFAGFLVEGFRNVYPDMRIVLSPRNKEQAEKLASNFNCEIATSNQQVSDEADIIIVSVRPNVFKNIVKDIKFKSHQTVISVASGISIEMVSDLVSPANAIRALPISSAAINQSPILMMPNNSDIKSFLEILGKVYVIECEEEFTAAAAYSAFYGWGFRLMDEAANWGAENGLEKEKALEIIRDVFGSVPAMSEKEAHKPLDVIVESLATKGGITELGLNVIDQQHGFDAWKDALEAVHKKLSN